MVLWSMRLNNIQRVLLITAAVWLAVAALYQIFIEQNNYIDDALNEALDISKIPLAIFGLLFLATFGLPDKDFKIPSLRERHQPARKQKKTSIRPLIWRPSSELPRLNLRDGKQCSLVMRKLSSELWFIPAPRFEGDRSSKEARTAIKSEEPTCPPTATQPYPLPRRLRPKRTPAPLDRANTNKRL